MSDANEKAIYGMSKKPVKPPCIYTPPDQLNINNYLRRLTNILEQMSSYDKKPITLSRLEILQEEVRQILANQTR
jgi:hypothetical protein